MSSWGRWKGHKKQTKADIAKYMKEWRKKNIEHKREYEKKYGKSKHGRRIRARIHIEQSYRVSATEADKLLLAAQKNRCAICKKKCSVRSRLSIDHDHKTNKIRGLLCMKCNHGLGQFNDDPKLLREAAKYVTIRKSS